MYKNYYFLNGARLWRFCRLQPGSLHRLLSHAFDLGYHGLPWERGVVRGPCPWAEWSMLTRYSVLRSLFT